MDKIMYKTSVGRKCGHRSIYIYIVHTHVNTFLLVWPIFVATLTWCFVVSVHSRLSEWNPERKHHVSYVHVSFQPPRVVPHRVTVSSRRVFSHIIHIIILTRIHLCSLISISHSMHKTTKRRCVTCNNQDHREMRLRDKRERREKEEKGQNAEENEEKKVKKKGIIYLQSS